MYKEEFLSRLQAGLAGLPREDVEERVTFYGEMIDDRMEEGLSQEDAVAQVGPVEDVIDQIRAEFSQPQKEKRKLGWAEIVLLVLSAPVWLTLLLSLFAVVLSVYASVWAVVISLWAVDASLAGCSFGGVAAAVSFAIAGKWPGAVAVLGGGLVCAGLAVFLFFGCTAAVRGMVWLTKKGWKLLITGRGKRHE